MPNVDGISLVKELRATSELKDTAIIVFTSFGRAEIDSAILAGANRAIAKPTHFESLIDDINELLAERKKR